MLISNNYYNLYTQSYQAKQITNIIKKYQKDNSIIADVTAGIGGNSISFCKNFNFVYCIDICLECIIILEHNLKNFNNKFIINHDLFEIIKIINTDIIFIDPPWGGSNYKYNNNLNLYINNIDINYIVDFLFFYCKLITIKVPKNYHNYKSNLWNIKKYNIYKNNKYEICFNILVYYKNI